MVASAEPRSWIRADWAWDARWVKKEGAIGAVSSLLPHVFIVTLVIVLVTWTLHSVWPSDEYLRNAGLAILGLLVLSFAGALSRQ